MLVIIKKGCLNMGLRCSCGVRTNPTATASILFRFQNEEFFRIGPMTMRANICANRRSTLSVTFDDESGMTPNRSFTFTSTDITEVNCTSVGGGLCEVSIVGMGLVSGELTRRQFQIILFEGIPGGNDLLVRLEITGFTDANGFFSLEPDLTFFC
jgi:hypothetical protein